MCQIMQHRGPDDEGAAFIRSDTVGASGVAVHTLRQPITADTRLLHDVALGHRRFSIIAPTSAGHQPFWSTDGNLCLVFNGEIYNYVELRQELEAQGMHFRTDTDTEVLLQAFRCWDTDALAKLRGFWAFALYDARRRAVLLSRDPIGKAPLYICKIPGGFAWASEIKALRLIAAPDTMAPREQAIRDFVEHGWRDLDNHTFYSGVDTFPAGSFAWVREGSLGEATRFWSIPTERATERELPANDAVAQFRELFFQAVTRQLRADVPLAAELSGGMDSSSIVAAAISLGHALSTYTVRFPQAHSNEEPYARILKDRYRARVDYHVVEEPADSFWAYANDYLALMDEPFHAPNMVTNFVVWQEMANDGIRVSLNGAAGDEVLAGYTNDYAWRYIRHLLRQKRIGRAATELIRYRELPGGLLAVRHLVRVMRRSISRASDDDLLRVPAIRHHGSTGPRDDLEGILIDLMGNWRMNYWLRSGMQSCMGVPMEVRTPFLDRDLVEFAFRLPTSYLIRNGWHKWILREAMRGSLPEEIVWRKRKMGFPFPIREWLAASRGRFLSVVADMDCPYLDLERMRNRYVELSQGNPYRLWRLMAVALWWKRCVLQKAIE